MTLDLIENEAVKTRLIRHGVYCQILKFYAASFMKIGGTISMAKQSTKKTQKILYICLAL